MIEWIEPEERDAIQQEDYPELWAEARRLLPDLTDFEIRTVVALVVLTCRGCWANHRSYCFCLRDD